ncbi:hypothetical protein PTMSG1_07323 [Pyrenophora teres f. maculata]|nr:hypothetical protein PTMSG1_07323 [Pyrenophora teres f. maculata]
MSQPNTPSHSPCLPGNRRYRGWGQGQGRASSDPPPIPETALRQNRDRSPYTQKLGLGPAKITPKPQRQSDTFYYDSQSIPYWDDSTGVIHNIPSSPSRHHDESRVKPIAGWYNPYTEIVGGGFYSQVSAPDGGAATFEDRSHTHDRSTETTVMSECDFLTKRPTSKEDTETTFKNVSDSFHVQSDKSVEISKKNRLRRVFRKRDASEELRQGATATIKAAALKCGVRNIREHKSSTSLNVTGLLGKKNSKLTARTSSWAFSHRPATSASPNIPKVGDSFAVLHTRASSEERKPPVANASFPLKAFVKKQEAGRFIERTPTLDRVRKLRTEEQAKAFAILEGRMPEVETTQEDDLQFSGKLALHVIKPKMTRARRNALNDKEHQESNSIMGVDLLDGNSASSSVYSSDEGDELEKLAKAVAGLRPFQDLPSPSKLGSFQHYSVIPDGLDLRDIHAVKEQAGGNEPCGQEENSQGSTVADAEAKPAKAPSAVDTFANRTGAAHSSDESLVTLSSEDYDRLSGEEKLKMEQNGVKRRWYRGFRKV